MSTMLQEIHDVHVLVCAADGPVVQSVQDAVDLLGEAGFAGARWVALPAERLDETFFRLSSGMAGDVLQKFANYRTGLAVVGDVTEHTSTSGSFRDFVREANTGRNVWFVDDLDEFAGRLAT